jgi:hypothetical protein
MSLKRRCHPVSLTHELRKRLWWRAQRLSFAAVRHPHPGLLNVSRKEWAQVVYLILIRHPEQPSD